MKNALIITLIFFSFSCFAQKESQGAIKLLVLAPDSASINSSLNSYKDRLMEAHTKRYYQYLKTYEDMANCKKCDFEKADMERYQQMAADLKTQESALKKFNYFQLISFYSRAIYDSYYAENSSLSFKEQRAGNTSIEALKVLAVKEKADFIVFFSNIKTVGEADALQLSLTTKVFSRKENKLIFTQETFGDLINRGETWACENPLDCLLMNAARASTGAVVALLKNLEKPNNTRN
jgi:hypothetical protein